VSKKTHVTTTINGESAYVNNFLFFAARSLANVRHLIDAPRSHDDRFLP
jgi:hypothetical protein